LAHSVMVHDDLAEGRLLRLYPKTQIDSALAYHIV